MLEPITFDTVMSIDGKGRLTSKQLRLNHILSTAKVFKSTHFILCSLYYVLMFSRICYIYKETDEQETHKNVNRNNNKQKQQQTK